MTRDPNWKFTANLGDANPLDHGGLFLYVDETNVYPPELELLEEPPEDSKEGNYEIYRVVLDQLKIVTERDDQDRNATHTYLVPASYTSSWPYPVSRYDVWFHERLADMAESADADVDELRREFTSDEPMVRARAYLAAIGHLGAHEFDQYKLVMTRTEVEARYTDGELG